MSELRVVPPYNRPLRREEVATDVRVWLYATWMILRIGFQRKKSES